MSISPRALPVRLLGLTALILGLLLVAQPGAYAASKTVRDTADDVYGFTAEDSEATRQPGPVGDILSVTTSHSRKTVRVRVHVGRVPLRLTSLLLRIKTPGASYAFQGVADVGMRQATLLRGGSHNVRCPGIRAGFRPDEKVVIAFIPRGCLGDPTSVQVGALLLTADSTVVEGDLDDLLDSLENADYTVDVAGLDTISKRALQSMSGPRVPLGPKVRVG